MNREMLLECNNIHFESKLGNIRQMASKLFSSGAKPFVDDFPQDGIEMSNMNVSNDGDDEKTDGSWKDVKKIFETFNKQMVTPQTSNHNQQQKILNERKDGHSRKLIKDQNTKLSHRKNFDQATTEISTSEAVHDVECGETNANKENILDLIDKRSPQYRHQSSNCSIQESRIKIETIQSTNGSASSSAQSYTPVSTFVDNSKQDSSLYDQSNRVRQVNVEMFTVTLKRSDKDLKS